ncbi:MAG: imidazole glycerol phosphate synthase subunit HisH [Candidatus Methanomethyliaceae archaeon]|nr:imidazole glycerol phosphate synthase subunit HisH [Candidatus Methanomethyliaceae archaeon]
MKVAILDLGLGNLLSIKRGLERVGGEVLLATKEEEIHSVDAIIIPGVGAFRDGIIALKRNFRNIFDKPILGICLGMQLLLDRSYEGGVYEGMGFIRGEVIKLPSTVKIPHMGWNDIIILRESSLLEGIKTGDYFYFVHSYYCKLMEDVSIAITDYGVKFPSIIEKNNFIGVQFHPEKSGKKGLIFLKNFLRWCKK